MPSPVYSRATHNMPTPTDTEANHMPVAMMVSEIAIAGRRPSRSAMFEEPRSDPHANQFHGKHDAECRRLDAPLPCNDRRRERDGKHIEPIDRDAGHDDCNRQHLPEVHGLVRNEGGGISVHRL